MTSMNKKQLLQKVIGDRGTEKVLYARNAALHLKAAAAGLRGQVTFCDGRPFRRYGLPGRNVFFGYYDLDQYSPDMDKLLVHIVKKNADPAVDPAELAWIDPADGAFHKLTETRAWCWQQGARLRWHPVQKNTILFNDDADGRYCARALDLDTRQETTVSRALYDLDRDFRYGLSLNFDRLQRLRPGYGYSRRPDVSAGEASPATDGVFRVDLETGSETLLFSLRELAQDVSADGAQHYINHLCVSPNGKRFMFFHLWTKNAQAQWDMRFYVADMDGGNLTMLEDGVRISHYCWVDDDTLLATRRVRDKEFRHVFYDLRTGEKTVNQGALLDKDGHPSMIRQGFITDTYPQKNMLQYVYLSDRTGQHNAELLRLFAEPLCYGEHRCDLHPRVFRERFITIDTTAVGGIRSVLAFELNDRELEKLR